MSVHTAEPGDIYQDDSGTVWKVTHICNEKTVNMIALYPSGGPCLRNEKGGGCSGLMWQGFKKMEPKE